MKKCPFCAEEIQDEAVKCQYCKEYLDAELKKKDDIKKPIHSDENKSVSKKDTSSYNEIKFVLGIAFAICLLYFGGWGLIWAKEGMYGLGDFLVEDNGLLIRVNNLYYGLLFENRFFDSPALSWIFFFIALGAIGFEPIIFFGRFGKG